MSQRQAGISSHPSTQLRRAALEARARNRLLRAHGPGALGHQRPQIEEHYHLIYHVPAENLAIPYFKEVFTTSRDAHLKLRRLGRAAEPRTEWYEDGEVGFETRVPGRLGLYWVVAEVTGCVRFSCSQFMTRDQRKGTLTTIPIDGDIVRTERR